MVCQKVEEKEKTLEIEGLCQILLRYRGIG